VSARIVWLSLANPLLLQGVPHHVLVDRPTEIVAEVPDAGARRLLRAEGARVIYWRRSDWDQAVAGLSPPEIDEVVHRRRQSYDLRRVRHGELELTLRRCIGQAAVAAGPLSASADSGAGPGLYVRRVLDILGATPYAGMSAREAFDVYVHSKEQARTYAEEAAGALGKEGGSHFREVADSVARDFAATNHAATRAGHLDLTTTRLHVSVRRVYLVTPFEPSLEESARRRYDVAERWHGGGLVVWPVDELEIFGTRKVELVDIDPAFLQGALVRLTPAQLGREVKRRLAAPPGRDAWLRLVDRLWLQAAVDGKRLAATLQGHDAALAAEVRQANAAELPRLLATWSHGNGLGGQAAAADARAARDRARACNAEAVEDADLVAALDEDGGDAAGAAASRRVRDTLVELADALGKGAP